MILILAVACGDATAQFAAELAPARSAVLTCTELTCEPSCLRDPDFAASTLTVAGERLPVGAIAGVVNLLPVVLPDALTVYAPGEREYQAAEMHAWLAFLLSNLDCPVVNRPTPLSLTGPALSPLGWLGLARAAGIPLAAIDVDSDGTDAAAAADQAPDVELVAVGGEIVEASGTDADLHTAVLARLHGLSYLKASYVRDGADCAELRLAKATSVPDLRDAGVRSALVRLLTR